MSLSLSGSLSSETIHLTHSAPPMRQVYAGELNYVAPDNGQVGYKVYIGPDQYFVITDIGQGRYQWYAFLAKPVGTAESEAPLKPTVPVAGCAAGNPAYLRNVFDRW